MTGQISESARLAKLFKLALSTDKDGEALSALAAIKRILTEAGSDIHSFGDLIEACSGTATSIISTSPSAAALSCFATCSHVDFAR